LYRQVKQRRALTGINSMFRWYKNAANCYVYLSDVSTKKRSRSSELLWEPAFTQSRWFTEDGHFKNFSPAISRVFSPEMANCLVTKESLEQQIHEATGIAIKALQGHHLSQFSYNDRKSWLQTERLQSKRMSLLPIRHFRR